MIEIFAVIVGFFLLVFVSIGIYAAYVLQPWQRSSEQFDIAKRPRFWSSFTRKKFLRLTDVRKKG